MTLNVSRIAYLSVFLLAGLGDWLYSHYRPDQNADKWLAAMGGALILRLVLKDKLTGKAHVQGFVAGTLAGCILGATIHRNLLESWDDYAVYGFVGFVADITLQLVAMLMTNTRDNPGAAIDEGLKRAEQVTGVWSRIKAPLLDLVSNLFKPKQ